MAIYDRNTAMQKVGAYTTSKWGRAPQNDAEWGAIGQGIDLNNIDDAGLNRAYSNADAYTASLGAQPAAAPPPANNPAPAAPPPAAAVQTAVQEQMAKAAAQADPANNRPEYGADATRFIQPIGPPSPVSPPTPIMEQSAKRDALLDPQNNRVETGPDPTRMPPGAVSPTIGNTTPAPGAVAPGPVTPPAPTAPAAPGSPNIPPNLQDLIPGLFAPRTPSPLDLQTQQALSDLLTRSQAPVSLEDPNLKPASETYRVGQQRSYERLRSAAAERANANGTINSGGFDTEALGYLADAGTNTAQYNADLVHQESLARRDDLVKGIALANQSGQFDKAQQLQTQLALLDATLQQEGLGLQRQQLDLNRELGRGNLDVQRGGLGLSRELGLGDLSTRNNALTLQGQLGRGDLGLRLMQSLMQNDQFFSQLGLSAAQSQQLYNQIAMQTLLGGF